jgi:hypothetical protein
MLFLFAAYLEGFAVRARHILKLLGSDLNFPY